VPGTNITVLHEGSDAITIHRRAGGWDFTPLSSRPGVGFAWVMITRNGRPVTSPWPITPQMTAGVPLAEAGRGSRPDAGPVPV
jgi:hypothetical protein